MSSSANIRGSALHSASGFEGLVFTWFSFLFSSIMALKRMGIFKIPSGSATIPRGILTIPSGSATILAIPSGGGDSHNPFG
jgi:hypothetical protein